VLHSAHYQESSALVTLFTRHSGIVRAVARGVFAQNKKANSMRSSLQMASYIECRWGGKTSLKTLYDFEQLANPIVTDSKSYLCIAYVHELLMHFLPEAYVAESVFFAYARCLQLLALNQNEIALRHFELDLLNDLGYGMEYTWNADAQEPIQIGGRYAIKAGHGVVEDTSCNAILGGDLIALQQREFDNLHILALAKKVNRYLIHYYMEGKSIKSRAMYQDLFSST